MSVSEQHVISIGHWLDAYVEEFYIGDERFDSAIRLKLRHTRNVAAEAWDIARSLGLSHEDCCLARIGGLLHDAGRFEQYARYQTYRDAKSEDHAVLGVKVLCRAGILDRLGLEEGEVIRDVVLHHNRACLPMGWTSRPLRLLKLVRDADKIDIFRVVTEHYGGRETNRAVEVGLPDEPKISEAVVERIRNGLPARVEDVRTLNDFKLLQLGWVFDINFPHSFEILRKRRYLQSVRAALPDMDCVDRAYLTVCGRLGDKCRDNGVAHSC